MLNPLTDSMSSLMQPMQNCEEQLWQVIYSETSSLDIDPRLAIEYEVTEQKMHSLLTGMIAGCTGTVSVPIRALSGELVLIHGTPQSSLSLVMCEHCIVVGRLLGELVVGRLAVDVVGRLLGEFVVFRPLKIVTSLIVASMR